MYPVHGQLLSAQSRRCTANYRYRDIMRGMTKAKTATMKRTIRIIPGMIPRLFTSGRLGGCLFGHYITGASCPWYDKSLQLFFVPGALSARHIYRSAKRSVYSERKWNSPAVFAYSAIERSEFGLWFQNSIGNICAAWLWLRTKNRIKRFQLLRIVSVSIPKNRCREWE